jgi:hypothetical protein
LITPSRPFFFFGDSKALTVILEHSGFVGCGDSRIAMASFVIRYAHGCARVRAGSIGFAVLVITLEIITLLLQTSARPVSVLIQIPESALDLTVKCCVS